MEKYQKKHSYLKKLSVIVMPHRSDFNLLEKSSFIVAIVIIYEFA